MSRSESTLRRLCVIYKVVLQGPSGPALAMQFHLLLSWEIVIYNVKGFRCLLEGWCQKRYLDLQVLQLLQNLLAFFMVRYFISTILLEKQATNWLRISVASEVLSRSISDLSLHDPFLDWWRRSPSKDGNPLHFNIRAESCCCCHLNTWIHCTLTQKVSHKKVVVSPALEPQSLLP